LWGQNLMVPEDKAYRHYYCTAAIVQITMYDKLAKIYRISMWTSM